MSKQEEMYTLVNEYRNSGLSAKAFSKEKGISPSAFCYWIRKKKDEDRPGGICRGYQGIKVVIGRAGTYLPQRGQTPDECCGPWVDCPVS